MIHRLASGILPTLVLVAVSGCRDAKSSGEQSDTTSIAAQPGVSHSPKNSDISEAADVVKRYYDAIGSGRYDSAYVLWEGSGSASGKTIVEFENGFAQTERTSVAIGDSVHMEGAAGSQYATVPVSVEAVLRGGARQHFVGTYTVRRAVADGATPEQRTWHIYSAHLAER